MMTDILLLYPGRYGEKDPNLPTPLLYLAKPLIESGFTVEILDTRIAPFTSFDFSRYKIIGISVMTAFYKQAQRITGRIKQLNKNAIVVWGGHHPTLMAKETLERNPLVDFIICGEGEITFLQLCNQLLRGEGELSEIGGLGRRNGDQAVVKNQQSIVDLDTMWDLPYHLVSIKDYLKATERFEFHTSRGCPHHCGFCSNSLHTATWRGKRPEVMIRELEKIISLFSPRMISIFDANFFVNKRRVREFCEMVIERDIQLSFYMMARCDYFAKYEPEFLELLKKAGFSEIAMGAESGSPGMLEYFNKGFSPETVLKSVDNCVAFKMKPILSFIVAAPHETEEDLRLTLDLYDEIIAHGGFVNGIFLFVPYPGNKITEEIAALYDLSNMEDLYDKSLYDMKQIGYHSKEYETICQGICYCAHLFWVRSVRRGWTFARRLMRDKSIIAVFFNDATDLFLYCLAKLRWRLRFFKYGYDLKLYWRLRNRFFSMK